MRHALGSCLQLSLWTSCAQVRRRLGTLLGFVIHHRVVLLIRILALYRHPAIKTRVQWRHPTDGYVYIYRYICIPESRPRVHNNSRHEESICACRGQQHDTIQASRNLQCATFAESSGQPPKHRSRALARHISPCARNASHALQPGTPRPVQSRLTTYAYAMCFLSLVSLAELWLQTYGGLDPQARIQPVDTAYLSNQPIWIKSVGVLSTLRSPSV